MMSKYFFFFLTMYGLSLSAYMSWKQCVLSCHRGWNSAHCVLAQEIEGHMNRGNFWIPVNN